MMVMYLLQEQKQCKHFPIGRLVVTRDNPTKPIPPAISSIHFLLLYIFESTKLELGLATC